MHMKCKLHMYSGDGTLKKDGDLANISLETLLVNLFGWFQKLRKYVPRTVKSDKAPAVDTVYHSVAFSTSCGISSRLRTSS